MLLEGANGDRLALRVYGYQYPGECDDYDANWLLIDLTASQAGRAWRSLGAILLTWEVAGLADWFDALAVEGSSEPEFSFIEPNLHFISLGVDSIDTSIRIFFELESRPNWARSNEAPAEEEFWIDVTVSPEGLKAAASSLREDLNRFPYRGVR